MRGVYKKLKIFVGVASTLAGRAGPYPPLDFAGRAGSAEVIAHLAWSRGGVGKGVGNPPWVHHRQVAGFIASAMPTAMPSVMAPLMATNATCLIASIISSLLVPASVSDCCLMR